MGPNFDLKQQTLNLNGRKPVRANPLWMVTRTPEHADARALIAAERRSSWEERRASFIDAVTRPYRQAGCQVRLDYPDGGPEAKHLHLFVDNITRGYFVEDKPNTISFRDVRVNGK